MAETQLELPFSIDDAGGIDAIYVDQGPTLGMVSCWMTPHGLRNLDAEFCKEIREFKGSKKEYRRLKNLIIHNEHLHSVIKRNLLENLDRVKSETSRKH